MLIEMKPTKQAKKAILTLLETVPKPKHDLLQQVCSDNNNVSEKHVSKAIQKLLEDKAIIESEGYYSLLKEDVCISEADPDDEPRTKLGTVVVPFAEILRRRQEGAAKKKSCVTDLDSATMKDVDLDDEIRRLEAELAADDSSDESDSAIDEEEDGEEASFGANTVVEMESTTWTDGEKKDAPTVVCLSSLSEERIAPLPASCLPQNKKRFLKGIDKSVERQKKKVNNGLQQAVHEVLSGYVARSSERLPFYCRFCAKQYSNEKEFFDHKGGDLHKAAVEVERKASFCKLCRRQFTSPVQLKEHVSSRPHRERLETMRSRQTPRRNRGRENGQSQSQWC